MVIVGCCLVSVRVEDVVGRERVPYRDKGRLFMVLGLFLSGRVSMGKAAELLGLRVDDFWLLLFKLGVRYSVYDEEEVEEELDAYRRVFVAARDSVGVCADK